MSSLIQDYLVQAAILRTCLWVLFIGLAVAAHTAWSEEGLFSSDLDILEVKAVRTDTLWFFPYRLNANIAFAYSEDTAPVGPVFSNTPRLHLIAEPKREILWPTNDRWQIIPDSGQDAGRISLTPLLRFQSKEEQLEIKPGRKSIWIVWRKALPWPL